MIEEDIMREIKDICDLEYHRYEIIQLSGNYFVRCEIGNDEYITLIFTEMCSYGNIMLDNVRMKYGITYAKSLFLDDRLHKMYDTKVPIRIRERSERMAKIKEEILSQMR